MSFQRYESPVYLNHLQRYLPERRVTNEDLVQWMGKSIRGSWIEKRTGIVERRWVEKNQSCRDLAVAVGRKVLEGAGTSSSPGRPPGTASQGGRLRHERPGI
jgi:3-oxoacyl-[acyl-carrier-protein] synthase-3